MTTRQIPLVVDWAAEEGRVPLPLKIALGDHLVEIIGAGTKVPTRREVEVSNAVDNQETLTIRVMQGASNRVEANAPVGTYAIGGLAPVPKGTLAITLAFEVTPSLGFNLKAYSDNTVYEIDLIKPGKPLGRKAIAVLMEEEDRDAPTEFDGIYDRAEHHFQSVADEELPGEQAYVHTGMFLGWLTEHDLLDADFAQKSRGVLKGFLARKTSGAQLYKQWQGVLQQEMLNETANAFAQRYFDFHRGHYLEDYAQVLAPEGMTLLGVEDTWANYDALCARIDRRFEEWQAKRAEETIKWDDLQSRDARGPRGEDDPQDDPPAEA